MIRALFFTLGLLASTSALAAGTKEDCDTFEAGSGEQVWCYAYFKDYSLCARQQYRDPYEDWCRAYAAKNTGQCSGTFKTEGHRKTCELLAARERADDDRAELSNLEELDAKDGYSMSVFIEALARYNPARCGGVRNAVMQDVCQQATKGFEVAREGVPEPEAPVTLSSASAAITGEAAAIARGKEESRKWSFLRVVKDASALDVFREHLETEFSGDQLDFWLEGSGELSGSACADLVRKYDLLNSRGAVNISSAVRANIETFSIVPYVTCETTGADIGEGGDSMGGLSLNRIASTATFADQINAAAREVTTPLADAYGRLSRTDAWYKYLGER
jgi:hypothetical protein